jgi:hypothetical protein
MRTCGATVHSFSAALLHFVANGSAGFTARCAEIAGDAVSALILLAFIQAVMWQLFCGTLSALHSVVTHQLPL